MWCPTISALNLTNQENTEETHPPMHDNAYFWFQSKVYVLPNNVLVNEAYVFSSTVCALQHSLTSFCFLCVLSVPVVIEPVGVNLQHCLNCTYCLGVNTFEWTKLMWLYAVKNDSAHFVCVYIVLPASEGWAYSIIHQSVVYLRVFGDCTYWLQKDRIQC